MNHEPGLPKLDLTTFFLSVSAAAMQSLQGENGAKPDLLMAKQNIDLLELMQSKTHGNRTPDEEQLLGHLLFQLRMSYVDSEKKNKN
jgi:hypothetical protein